MAADSSDVIQRLEERAKEAEDTIEVLKKHLQDLTDKAANAGLLKEREEAAQLRKQNEALKQEINEMKKELTDLESTNQRLQVPLPVPGQKPPYYPNPPPVQAHVNGPSVQPVEDAPLATPTAIVTEQKETKEVAKSKKKEKGKKEASPSPAETSGGDQINVSRLNIKVGRIIAVKNHPDADTLYVEEVDVGEGKTRTVVSGLVKYIPINQMQDRIAIFLVNLKPAKMRGIVSEAMILCAETPERCEIIEPPDDSVPGDRVVCEGYNGQPDELLNPKKKIWDRIRLDLRTNAECIPTYKGVPFTVEGKGICKVPSLSNSGIK